MASSICYLCLLTFAMRSGLPLCITGLYWLELADRAAQALAWRRARLREAPLPGMLGMSLF